MGKVVLSVIIGIIVLGLIGFSENAFAEEFNISITGETNPRIDHSNYYIVQVHGKLGDERLLEVFLEHEIGYLKIDEWEFSKYDKELKFNVMLDMTRYDWDLEKEYKLVAKIGTTVGALDFKPKHWQTSNTSSTQEGETIDPYIKIIGILETKLPQQFMVGFDICAGSKIVVTPEITINSDIASDSFKVMSIMNPGSCLFYDISVKAQDSNSIKINFGLIVKDDPVISDLQKQIDELKLELQKKDAILMEQLKVIMQLASNLKTTIFEPISQFFGFA